MALEQRQHEDSVNVAPFKRKRLGVKASIYLLPNLITVLSLFFGLLSIRLATEGRLQNTLQPFLFSSYAILAAAVCDMLDGSVARLTRTQSAFGMQLDSLCDLVSFGVAPGWLAYSFALKDFGKIGFAAAFLFTACGALRLARFNVQTALNKVNKNFIGIPIPMAAAPIAVFVLAQIEMQGWRIEDGYYSSWVNIAGIVTQEKIRATSLFALVLAVAFGMISTFEYVSSKSLRLPKKRPFQFFAGFVVLLVFLLSFEFTICMAVLLMAYCAHGPILWLFTKHNVDEEELFDSGDTDSEE